MGPWWSLLVLVPWASAYVYRTQTFTVPVDHFSFAINDTFDIRYLVNDTYWKKNGGPIFFYTGNEGDIEMFAENTGFMWEIAPHFRALVVFAEHRYYGQSLPYGNRSYSEPKYLGYLTSQQALADYVDLITFLTSHDPNRRNPVIAFGGSYGGMLAAWIRIKYPHIVQGAIAASAPVRQFMDLVPCENFFAIITSDFKAAKHGCAQSIRKSWDVINNLTKTETGLKNLTAEWKLCKPLKSADDVVKLKTWLQNVYEDLAMTNYPYPTSFLMPLPAEPIKEVCGKILDISVPDAVLLKSLFEGVSVYFNYTGKSSCLNYDEDAGPKLGDLGWQFQACTEMVMPMCPNGKTDMYENMPWNLQSYSDECFRTFKVRPQGDLAVKLYGGRNLSFATNIVFSNGLLDPWSSGGVLSDVSKTAVAVLIPEGAHHLDLRASNALDPVSVRGARSLHRVSIKRWIAEYHYGGIAT